MPYNPEKPKYGHTFDAVGLSDSDCGGADANSNVTDGLYKNKNRGIFERPDPNAQALGIFDFSSLTWRDHYPAQSKAYTQSEKIRQYYAQAG